MISSSRIYIFKVCYKDSTWLSEQQADQLSTHIGQVLLTGIKDFTFKDLQLINVYNTNSYGICEYSTQVHINKFTFRKQKVLSKEHIAELLSNIKLQFKKILNFQFEDVLVVNDEFDIKPTSGLIGG